MTDIKQICGLPVLGIAGAGGEATVYIVEKDGKKALKVLKTIEYHLRGLENLMEIDIMCRLRHPNLMAAEALVEGKECNGVSLLLPYAPRTLADVINDVSPPLQDLLAMLHQVICATQFLLQNRIINADIKPANVAILEDGTAKMFDFGRCIRFDGNSVDSKYLQGTWNYQPPELLQGTKFTYNEKTVVWQLGMNILLVLGGTYAIGTTKNEILEYINEWFQPESQRKHTLKTFLKDDIKDETLLNTLVDLLSHMLDPDITQRYLVDDVLKDPIFANFKCEEGKIVTVPSPSSLDCHYSIGRVLDAFRTINFSQLVTSEVLFTAIDLVYRTIDLVKDASREDILAHNLTCFYIAYKLYEYELPINDIHLAKLPIGRTAFSLYKSLKFTDILNMEVRILHHVHGCVYRPYLYDACVSQDGLIYCLNKVIPKPELYRNIDLDTLRNISGSAGRGTLFGLLQEQEGPL